ncbi:MAG TPA: FecR family protein [Hyphomicrobiaceae bacterium]|nr:FecR family protein [Hyphomicrobiaceae bacterium]
MLRLGVLRVVTAVAALAAALPDGAAAQTVGTAAAVNPQVQGGERILQVGSNIVFRERVSTSANGSTQVIFVDKTTLSIGPNSNILIDEFVYNPDTGAGRMTVTLTKGAMRMVGGNVSHTQGATIKTPLATIGVRGGVASLKHDGKGTRAISHFGTVTVVSGGATETITRPGYGVSVGRAGAAPSAPAPVPQAEIAALTRELTSRPTQTGGVSAENRPTDPLVVAMGLGETNANLVPFAIDSVQGHNASQAAGSTKVPPVQSQGLGETVDRSGEQASQQGETPRPPRPAFYALAMPADPALGSGVPYLPAAFAVPGTYVVSDVLGYRRGGIDPASGRARFGSLMLQAGLSINGSGPYQTSTFFVMTGAFIPLADGTQFYTAGFEASTRRAANLSAGFASGAVSGDPANTTLNSDRIPTGALVDQNTRDAATGTVIPVNAFYFPGGGDPSAFYTFSQAASATAPPPGIGQTRPDTPLSGFVAGLARTLHSSQQIPTDTTYTSAGPSFPVVGGITIAFDSERGRMQANAVLTKVANYSGLAHEFSTGAWQVGSLDANARASSTFIDDRLFAGRDAVNEPATTNTNTTQISTSNGQVLDRSRQAFASADLVQAQTFFPGVNFANCVCEFTRWGFWSADNYRSNGDLTTETDRAHLMTWVAGRLASPAEVPLSGTAVYNGFVVGSFKAGSDEYVAAGNFQANVNFASGATVSIPSLDGRTYAGSVTRTPGLNELAGTLSGTGGASMAINGAFFRGASDPVKDVAGRFSVTGNPVGPGFGYIGAGIFAGSR